MTPETAREVIFEVAELSAWYQDGRQEPDTEGAERRRETWLEETQRQPARALAAVLEARGGGDPGNIEWDSSAPGFLSVMANILTCGWEDGDFLTVARALWFLTAPGLRDELLQWASEEEGTAAP